MDHVYLSVLQLESLATAARDGSKGYFRNWWVQEVDKVVVKLLRGEQYAVVRPFRRLFGYPSSVPEAQEKAKEIIAKYAAWEKPWECLIAINISEKWLGVAKNVAMFQGFNVPKNDYDTMIAWAAIAPKE